MADAEAGTDGKVLTGKPTDGVRFVKASTIRPGDYIMIDGRACKVITITTSKTGKHGRSKVKVDYEGIGDSSVLYWTEAQVAIIPSQ